MVKFSVNCFIFRARSFKTASASFVFFFSFFIQGTPLFSPYLKLSYLILWPGFFSSLKIKQSIRRLLLLFLTKWKLKESRLNFQETVDLLCVVWSPRWPTLGRYYFFFFSFEWPKFQQASVSLPKTSGAKDKLQTLRIRCGRVGVGTKKNILQEKVLSWQLFQPSCVHTR